MYDIAIIGSGPAGVAAAINAKVLNKNFIWLSGKPTSDKVARAELIKNYPGLPSVTGSELGWTFLNHTESMKIKLTQTVITGVYDLGDKFALLAGNTEYEAKTVILCVGVQAKKPYDGEEEFLGRGVSYCATCDGNLYKGKNIAVVATDKSFGHEIEYLCSLAAKVSVIPLYRDCTINCNNAEIIVKTPVKITGSTRAEKLWFKDGSLSVDGIFILRDAIAPSALMHGLEVVEGHIAVNRKMQTNIKGVFAAGDCTGKPYQYVKAAGEGNAAVYYAIEYLSENKV